MVEEASFPNIAMPLFAGAGNVHAPEWNDVDNIDVDVLAEYLLEDGEFMPGGMTFDFAIDGPAVDRTQTVSPENSEDGNMPPVADANDSHQQLTGAVANPLAPRPVASYAQHRPQQQQHEQQQQQQQTPTTPGYNNTITFEIPDPTPVGSYQYQPQQQQAPPPPPPPTNSQQAPTAHQRPPLPQIPILPAPVPSTSAPTPALNPVQYQSQPSHPKPKVQDPTTAKRQRVETTKSGTPVTSGALVSVSSSQGSVVLTQEQLSAAAAQMQQGRGARKKSQAQIDRRRERNRILARRTRLRKKFFFESLQKEVMDLQKENSMLKELVKEQVAESVARPLLKECDAMAKLPPSVLEACGENDMDSQDFNLVKSIQMSQHSFIITDPSLHDNPIVFASDAFLKLTGYDREDVLGQNCRFLQGPATDKTKIEMVGKCMAAGEDVTVTFINYKADGTPFWNKLFIAALRDAENNVVNHIGVLAEVACPPPDDPEHQKPLPVVNNSNDDVHSSKKSDSAEYTVRAIEGAVSAAVAAAKPSAPVV